MNSNILRSLTVLLLLGSATVAQGGYNANLSGTVTSVAVYADGDYVLFRLLNQPTTHASCDPEYFVIAETIPQSRRSQMYAQLIAAKYSGEPLIIGYDSSGDCSHGYIRVHRVG
jgi:hypothetical protein